MTEYAALSTRRDRGKPSPLTAQPGMSHGIHTSVDPVQPACGDPPGYALRSKAGTNQLLERHDAVLARGNLGNKFIGGCELLAHTANKSHGAARAPLWSAS
jgi:hypothetical protein